MQKQEKTVINDKNETVNDLKQRHYISKHFYRNLELLRRSANLSRLGAA